MNMACLFYLFLLFCFATSDEATERRDFSIVKINSDIIVHEGNSVFLNQSHISILAKDFLLCRVEVIFDPICLRFGNISSTGFSCRFDEEKVLYGHDGSLISAEDCMKLRFLVFYKDRTETEMIKIKFKIVERNADEKLSRGQIDTKETGGAVSFGHEILPNIAHLQLKKCKITFKQNKRWPANGKLIINQGISQMPCDSFNVIYKHDSSYSPNIDYIPFEIILTNASHNRKSLVLRYHLKVRILPAQKNDPPYIYSRFSRIVIRQYALKQILASNIRAVDFKTRPNDLLFKVSSPKKNDLGGYFATIDRPDLPLEGITQQQVNEKRIIFVSPKTLTRKSRSSIQQMNIQAVDIYGASSKRKLRLMFFVRRFVAYYLTVIQNNPVHVLEGQTYRITSWNIDIACKSSKCERAKFSVWSGPQYGKLLKNSKQINIFTKADIMNGILTYEHDGSETLTDSIVVTISDKYQMAYATLSIIIEPYDDSPPFLSVNKEIVTTNDKRTRIETNVLKAADHDTVKDRIMFHIARKPRKGDIVKMNTNGSFKNVGKFTEIELERGLIYYEKYSEKPSKDSFSFILSDGGKKPNLSREYTSRVRIKAVDRSPPYRIDDKECHASINETTRILSLNFLSYADETSLSSEIVFTLKPQKKSMNDNEDVVQLEDIFQLFQHKKLPVKNFTQMQVFHNKKFFSNRYKEIGLQPKTIHLSFVASDKDGHETALQDCKISIRPVDNIPPKIMITQQLEVLEGNILCVDSKIIILNDEDTDTSILKLSFQKMPKHGEMKLGDEKAEIASWIPYKNLLNQSLCYNHNGNENTRDDFILIASDGIQSSQKHLFIYIIPVNDERPTFTRDSVRISVMENSSVVLDSKLFKVIDKDSQPSNLSFFIISEPSAGRVTSQEHYTRNFTQIDLENGQLVYSHIELEIGPYAKHDSFRVKVCDVVPFSVNCSSILNVNIDVIPINSRPPRLSAKKRLNVNEGGKVVLDKKILHCFDNDTVKSDIEIQIVKFPRFGFIENIAPSEGSELSNSGIHISTFKCSDLRKETIYYVQNNHTGIEPIHDNVTLIAFDGKFQSNVIELNIDIEAVSDEDPIIDMDVIKVHEGGWKLIDSKFIRIKDRDIPKENLVFFLENRPKHGQMFYRCTGVDPGLKRLSIHQKLEYQKCILVYGHDDSESRFDKFNLAASDGRKTTRAEVNIEVIPVNDQKPKVLKNITMTVRYGRLKNISNSYLNSRDLDTPDQLIEYKIHALPMYGSLKKRDVITGLYTSLSINSTFKQSDINKNAVSYTNHLMPVSGFMDSFRFSLTDGVHVSNEKIFYIRIKQSCRKYLSIIAKDIQVNNKRVWITDSTLRVETRASGSTKRINGISYQIIKPPTRGVLTLSGRQKDSIVFSFTQFDLNEKKVKYIPNEYPLKYNDSFKFLVTDGKCLQRGRINIFATKVRKKIKLLDRNSRLNVVQLGITTITPLELRAVEKFSPEDVVYHIIRSPDHGIIVKDGRNTTAFTQANINELSLGYNLVNGKAAEDKLKAKIFLRKKLREQGASVYENFTFNIRITIPKKLEPRMVINQPITSLEYLYPNVLGTIITKRNLLAYNCLSMNDTGLVYTVIEPPIHGELFHKDTGQPVSLFTQKDINEGKIIYKLTDKRLLSYDDKIFLEVSSDNCEKRKDIEFSIYWSVVTLLDDVSTKCSIEKTSVMIKLLRQGYKKQGSVVEIYMKSVGDEQKSFPTSRVWFYPNEVEKLWTLPRSVMDYELINIQLKNEFNTLLGKKKSIVVDIIKAVDSCSNNPATRVIPKQGKPESFQNERNQSITAIKEGASFHAIRLVKPASGSQSRQKIPSTNKSSFHKSNNPCERGWSEFNMNCYMLFEKPSNWRKAMKTCRKSHATLFIPTSTEEEQFTSKMHSGASIWLGIKQNKRGRWKWDAKKKERIVKRKLKLIESFTDGRKKCVTANDKGQWIAKDCKKDVLKFLCKKPSF